VERLVRLQLSTRASVRRNDEFGTLMLMFSFHLGPLEVFCLSHVPKDGEAYSKTYVKVGFRDRSLIEEGKRAEAWLQDEDGAWSTPGHAEVGGLPGTKVPESHVVSTVKLGPLKVRVNGGGEVHCSLAPRRTVEDESKIIDHWVVAR
jgi:hypothetical protein